MSIPIAWIKSNVARGQKYTQSGDELFWIETEQQLRNFQHGYLSAFATGFQQDGPRATFFGVHRWPVESFQERIAGHSGGFAPEPKTAKRVGKRFGTKQKRIVIVYILFKMLFIKVSNLEKNQQTLALHC